MQQRSPQHLGGRNDVLADQRSDTAAALCQSLVYTLPITGGTPEADYADGAILLPHGWSPDGKTLAFCGQARNDDFDIYTIPAAGSDRKTRLDNFAKGPR